MKNDEKLTIGSCFSGIGGLELGLERTGGFETKWQIEWDDYATKVLEKHWPNVKRYKDIRDVIRPEPVDIITGGYPCQPFSQAGKRQGEKDERHLWPELLRLIRTLRPRYALMENVTGHLSLGFGRVVGDLAESGYDAEWQVLSARQFGAGHRRERLFVLAYPSSPGRERFKSLKRPFIFKKTSQSINRNGIIGSWLELERDRSSLRNYHGVSISMERKRLQCIGNAVVPQIAEVIGKMILAQWEKEK